MYPVNLPMEFAWDPFAMLKPYKVILNLKLYYDTTEKWYLHIGICFGSKNLYL